MEEERADTIAGRGTTSTDDQPLAIEKGHASPQEIQEAVQEGQYVTVKQVAAECGYTGAWINELCKKGRIHGVKPLGGQWRIPKSELERIRREGIPPVPRAKPRPPSTRIQVPQETADKIAPERRTEPEGGAEAEAKRKRRVYPLYPLPLYYEKEE